MFFRFAAAIGLITAIGLAAIAIEKQNLSLKREISSQHYQLQIQQEKYSRLVLETQQLAAPPRLMEEWERGEIRLQPAFHHALPLQQAPLIEWRKQGSH
jgi:hypothetical protein